MRVAVAGASGYAGGELLRLIAGHPHLEFSVLTAQSSAGKAVADVHQHLAGDARIAELSFEPQHAIKQADCDLMFMALPSGQSAALIADIADDIKVVDLGPDFRLADPGAWTRHYAGAHAGRWITGLPELPGVRPLIKSAGRVAAPGCFSTAAIIGLAPLVAAGLIEPTDVVIVAASGTSGAGRTLRGDLLGSEVMGSVSAYQVAGAHRHTPEIEQVLSEFAQDGDRQPAVTVSFTPMLVPMPRGILATCTARLSGSDVDTTSLRDALLSRYAGEPFVHLLPEGRWPSTAAVAGSNGAAVQAATDHRAGRATVVVAIDNLGKGAAGQAIQNANLMLGLPETAGLTSIGVAP